jgi:hypothetical protein
MIATWKKQAVEGMAATFSGKAEAVQQRAKPSWPSSTPKSVSW